LKEHSDIEVERAAIPESLSLDHLLSEDYDAHLIRVEIRHLDDEEASPAQNSTSSVPDGLFRSNLAKEDTDDLIFKSHGKAGSTAIINANYMIGCDGAYSWTRRQFGVQMEGEQTDFNSGVLDIIPITNFPDIRICCAIHSADSGSVMMVPREKKLVRFYIQLNAVNNDGRQFDRSKISPEVVLEAAQRIICPWTLPYHYCDWWTAYQIGQRVGTSFSTQDRIFLAGDAVHTHSPKAGQGMNVSVQDTYNLGWKIGLVVKGLAKRSILQTYQSERRRIAQDLIASDPEFSRLFLGRPAKDVTDEAGISMAEFKEVFQKGAVFASGLTVDYGPSMLVAKSDGLVHDADTIGLSAEGTDIRSLGAGKQHLATNILLGMRFPSEQVLNQSSARPYPFLDLLPSDGRFRLLLFAGNLPSPTQWHLIHTLGASLATPASFLHRFTPPGKPLDSVIQILIIHSAPRTAIELLDLHEIFHPLDERTGWDYDKVSDALRAESSD